MYIRRSQLISDSHVGSGQNPLHRRLGQERILQRLRSSVFGDVAYDFTRLAPQFFCFELVTVRSFKIAERSQDLPREQRFPEPSPCWRIGSFLRHLSGVDMLHAVFLYRSFIEKTF